MIAIMEHGFYKSEFTYQWVDGGSFDTIERQESYNTQAIIVLHTDHLLVICVI